MNNETKTYHALGPDEVLRVGDQFKPQNSETWVVVEGLAGDKVRTLAPGTVARRVEDKQYATLSLEDILQRGDEFRFVHIARDWYGVAGFIGQSLRHAQESTGGLLEARRPLFGSSEDLEWEKVKRDDVLVANALLAGIPLEQIIVKLVADREKLAQQLIDTFNLLPRKYRLPDGSVRVWHAPDELIPVTNLPGQ